MPVGWLGAPPWVRCLILDFLDSARERFALYFRFITAWRLTLLRAPGDFCTKIIFRPRWSGAGLAAAYRPCCSSEESRSGFAAIRSPPRKAGRRGDDCFNRWLLLRLLEWHCMRWSIFRFRSPP